VIAWSSPRVRASAAYFAFFAGNAAFIPYSPLFYQSRGLGLREIGLTVSVAALIGLVAAPAWGGVADRLGGSPRVLLASGAIAVHVSTGRCCSHTRTIRRSSRSSRRPRC